MQGEDSLSVCIRLEVLRNFRLRLFTQIIMYSYWSQIHNALSVFILVCNLIFLMLKIQTFVKTTLAMYFFSVIWFRDWWGKELKIFDKSCLWVVEVLSYCSYSHFSFFLRRWRNGISNEKFYTDVWNFARFFYNPNLASNSGILLNKYLHVFFVCLFE